MSFWNALVDWLGDSTDAAASSEDMYASGSHSDLGCDINPASGLPMIGGCGGIDFEGNPYGADLHGDVSQTSSFDDACSSCGSDTTFDDTWSSCGSDISSWDE